MDKLKAVFANKDLALFPNQFVNIRLILEQRPNVLVVPAAALQTGSSGSFVYVVTKGAPDKDGKDTYVVNARPIVTTLSEGSQLLVDSGLQPGEQVVIDGQEKLRAGSPVIPNHGSAGSGGGSGSGKKGNTPGASATAPIPHLPPAMQRPAAIIIMTQAPAQRQDRPNESLPAIYSQAGCHIALDGGDSAGRRRRL